MNKMNCLKENIFAWYKFKESSNGILYATDEDYKNILSNKIKLISDKNINEQIDYVIFIGENDFSKIEDLKSYLKNDAKIIIINDNCLSASKLSKYPNFENNFNVKKSNLNNSIAYVKNEMSKFNYNECNVYYAFPNYNLADIIFKNTFNINEEQIRKYFKFQEQNEIELFDEIEFLVNMIKLDKNSLEIFANSYFIEFSREIIENDVEFVSYNNTRKEEYRLITIIRKNVVEKKIANPNAKNHLENLKKNTNNLINKNIKILDYVDNETFYSKLIENQNTFDMEIAEHFDDLDYVVECFNEIREILLENSIDSDEKIKENFNDEYNLDFEMIKNLKFCESAYIDFVPKNCFKIDGELYFFDQEWCEKFLPVDFIIYRGIINCYNLVKKIDVNILFDKLNLTQYIEIFDKVNEVIMKKVLDEELVKEIFGKETRKIENIINERKIAIEQIENFEKEDEKKSKIIKDFEEETKKINKYIEQLKQEEKNKQKYIDDLNNDITRRKEEEENKSEYICVLENIRSNQENEIVNLNNVNTKKDELINNLDEIINNLNEIIKVKDNQILTYENMKLVKLTKKLRGRK